MLGLLLSMLGWMPALALELEPVQVRSRVGQPLLAEIRMRDAPADLQALSVRLPEPVVFARIGLPRPRGAVADLRFSLRRDASGAPVIRVTTSQPVAEDFLTFLVEVQWREGSLVREFSVALPAADAPPALPVAAIDAVPATGPAAAIDALPIDPAAVDATEGPAPAIIAGPARDATAGSATEVPPIPIVARAPAPLAAERPAPQAPPIPVIPRATSRAAVSTSPMPAPAAPAAGVAPALPAPPVSAAASMAVATTDSTIDVGRGSHLTGIARASMAGDVPLEAALVAFLLANPDAFVDGNINRLRHGATLRVPSPEVLAAIDPQQARALVALQADDWRGGADDARRQAMASLLDMIQTGIEAAATPRTAAPIMVVPARMQIVPVDDAMHLADGDRSAQLPPGLEQEAMAARDAEIRHLQQQVAALERDNQQQRALIAMQDGALAQAQRHLDRGDGAFAAVRWPWLLLATLVAGLALLGWKRAGPRRRAAAAGHRRNDNAAGPARASR